MSIFGIVPQHIKPYFDLIEKLLEDRNLDSEWWKQDDRYNTIRLAVTISAHLSTLIKELTGKNVAIERIISAEICASGHVDYSRKLALYAYELSIE